MIGIGVILLLSFVLFWIPRMAGGSTSMLQSPAPIVATILLLVYFALGRRMIGNASAIVAAALLAISAPFLVATNQSHPLLLAETLALAGIAWLIALEAKHREVGLTGQSAIEASVAGALFGASLSVHPATLSTVIAAIVLWFSLGLRRSRATTLPSRRPGASVLWGVFGCATIVAGVVAAMFAMSTWGSMWAAGWSGAPIAWVASPEPVWKDAYRWIVSPFRETDVLVIAAILLVALIVSIESWSGSSWRGAGLLPWIYLLLYVLVGSEVLFGPGATPAIDATSAIPAIDATAASRLPRLPAPIPPLFVLGLGWLVLRGFSPGRVRRQEYTFLLVWLALAGLLLPQAVASETKASGASQQDAMIVVALTILPMVVLVAARAARAFWESERGWLARVGILSFACLPVIAALGNTVTSWGPENQGTVWAIALDRWLPLALGVAASLGALSVLVSVRPDPAIQPMPRGGGEPRRGFRGPRRRRGGRGRPHRGRPPRR